jgi:hypothetical protein
MNMVEQDIYKTKEHGTNIQNPIVYNIWVQFNLEKY